MTEEYTVRFTSPMNDCDLCSTGREILNTDPDLSDCNVYIRADTQKNSISITGSWHSISHLRRCLLAVFCTAIKEKQALLGDCIQSLVDKALEMDNTEAEEGTMSTNECTSTINAKSEGKSLLTKPTNT